MKKLIGTVVLAAMVAGAAFAEITMGAWLRGIYVPVAGNGDSLISTLSNSWSAPARTARIDISATSEDGKAGMVMGLYESPTGFENPGADDAKLWVKPWDWLKLTFGRYNNATLRGDSCYGSWNWLRPGNWIAGGEGYTFSTNQLGCWASPVGNMYGGALFELTPIESLYIFVSLPQVWGGDHKASEAECGYEAYKQFELMQAGIGYQIAEIGKVKLQWIADVQREYKINDDGTTDEVKDLGDIEIGFDLTGIENLYLTIGAAIDIGSKDYADVYLDSNDELRAARVALGFSYQILDNFKLSASASANFYKKSSDWDDVKIGPAIDAGIGIDVGLTDALSLSADFRFYHEPTVKVDGEKMDGSGENYLSFCVGLQYNCSSNGYVGIGFQGSTNGIGLTGVGSYKDKFAWAVPIAMSVWF